MARHILAGGKVVWIRRAGPHNPAWRYWLMGMLAKLLHAKVLTPVPNLGGPAAIAIETARLNELSAAGIYVPKLLARQANALMISNIPGSNLLERIKQEAIRHDLSSWHAGLLAISHVHAKRQFLSQAFARNMVIQGRRVGFIDFEDNPAAALDIIQCQSRDWLCYLQSTLLILQRQ
ncbi:hypothetical protein C7N83_11690, partial [Neisseria iguanae]